MSSSETGQIGSTLKATGEGGVEAEQRQNGSKADENEPLLTGNCSAVKPRLERLKDPERSDSVQNFIDGMQTTPGVEEATEQSIANLQLELRKAQEELKLKDLKCERLSSMQETVDKEIHELTTSLFQEAYKMVNSAEAKRQHAEKMLKEASDKIDILQAEVTALKQLVASSQHSGDYLVSVRNGKTAVTQKSSKDSAEETNEQKQMRKMMEFKEIDPIYHKELVGWREAQNPIDRQHPFLQRIYNEEISPCLNFQNAELAERILVAVEANSLYIEQIIDDKTIARLKVETDGEWHYISQLCRNRIAAVCDFFTYIRYLSQGLIKAGVHDAYWELIRLRKNMALARLGLGFCSSYQKI